MMLSCALLLVVAVLIDAFLGDPVYRLHPVRLIGVTIEKGESLLRKIPLPAFWQGFLLTLLVLGFWEGFLSLLCAIFGGSDILVFLLSIYILYSSLALRDLARHVAPVVRALEEDDLETARARLQAIVGRDTSVLDEAGVARAAMETAAEGFVDGYFSPVFWFALSALLGHVFGGSPCLFGAAGALGYRVVNTLDSMIGYKNARYLYFGRFAARLDDVMNFVPARLCVLFLFLGAWIIGSDAASGLETVVRHRRHAASPNAGYPESFIAGALHVQLGGPVQYPFGRVGKPFMGDGTMSPDPGTIRRAARLVSLAGYAAAGFTALVLLYFESIVLR